MCIGQLTAERRHLESSSWGILCRLSCWIKVYVMNAIKEKADTTQIGVYPKHWVLAQRLQLRWLFSTILVEALLAHAKILSLMALTERNDYERIADDQLRRRSRSLEKAEVYYYASSIVIY